MLSEPRTTNPARRLTGHRVKRALLAAGVVVASGIAAATYYANSDTAPETTGSIAAASKLPPVPRGPSGLPLPRYVSLKSNRVNVRVGPSQDHEVAWVFNSAGPAGGNHRRIRELAPHPRQRGVGGLGVPFAPVRPPHGAGRTLAERRAERAELLLKRPDAQARPVARLQHGALVRIEECDVTWCEVTAQGLKGYIRQSVLWGVYPGERVEG